MTCIVRLYLFILPLHSCRFRTILTPDLQGMCNLYASFVGKMGFKASMDNYFSPNLYVWTWCRTSFAKTVIYLN